MSLNPYANFVEGLDTRAVLAATPGLLHQAACALTPEQLEAPIAAGKWNVRQIAAHMADCELAFGFRLRQVLAVDASGPPATLQPFDQTAWATHYANYDLPAALELFKALRGWNLKLVGGLDPADFEREGFHPERGLMTFQTILETMAGHDLNHLKQVQNVASKA